MCDGKSDCGDNSDEENCPIIEPFSGSGDDDNENDCPEGRYLCSRSKDCIPDTWLCDQENDCDDWEDESTSVCGAPPNCTSGEFRCANGHCVKGLWECDGENDCGDNSDEYHCTSSCGPNEVQCPDRVHPTCIPTSWICDGELDCTSGWDEKNNCSTTYQPCDVSEFQCNNGECIPTEWECDGEQDCISGEDEHRQNCSAVTSSCHGKFRCIATGVCIGLHRVCDGVQFCPDGSDELEDSCNITPMPCQYSCGEICLTSKQICNGVSDCPDNSDEPQICHVNECSINNGGCSHTCNDKIIGHECQCPSGYTIKGNSTCHDIDECKVYGSCSQECFNTDGSFLCKCKPGYDLSRAANTCRAFGEPAVLFFANEQSIKAIDLKSHNKSVVFDHLGGVFSFDFDYHSNMVYWFENKENAIFRGHIGDQNSREKIIVDIDYTDGIAYDWIHHKIYWTDADKDIIEVADRDGRDRKLIVNASVNGTIEEPRAIAVDPFNKKIYWTDWGSTAKIEKASLNGHNRQAIVTTGVWWPNGLTLDFTLNRLYWIDAKLKRIETCDMNGHNRVLIRKLSFHSHPFSISVFEQHVYWSDWETGAVEVANKFTGGDRKQVIQSNVTRPLGVRIQQQVLQQPGVECLKPFQPHYNISNIRKDAYIAGRSLTIQCESGHMLIGNATITCSNKGTWKPHLPVCVPIRANCSLPKFPHYNITDTRVIYFEGENFTVKCIDGFKLIGKSDLTCSKAGNWRPHVPHCTKMLSRCTRPDKEQYNMTHISRDDYKFGHNLTITCNQGYQIVGVKEVTCSNDSTWKPSLPTCVPISPGTARKSKSDNAVPIGIGVAVAIVIALAAAMLILGGILFYRIRRQRSGKDHGSPTYTADDQKVSLADAEQPMGISIPEE